MHPIEKTCSPTHADIVAGKEMGRRNTGGENENGTTGSSHIPLRTWRENAETTMFQVIQVPFFPLDFSHLGAAWRWPTGRRVLRKGEGGSHLSAHTHLGACKPSTDFAKSGSLAGEEWGGGENFNFLHQMASFRKSPSSPTLSHTKNEKPAIRSSRREKNRWAA